uniref:Uncharacterized protein n=1 Tax=Arundo donax TaxID=35708 RepID=A0A0A9BUD3_ARUDO
MLYSFPLLSASRLFH